MIWENISFIQLFVINIVPDTIIIDSFVSFYSSYANYVHKSSHSHKTDYYFSHDEHMKKKEKKKHEYFFFFCYYACIHVSIQKSVSFGAESSFFLIEKHHIILFKVYCSQQKHWIQESEWAHSFSRMSVCPKVVRRWTQHCFEGVTTILHLQSIHSWPLL